jgi:hypothetical protein
MRVGKVCQFHSKNPFTYAFEVVSRYRVWLPRPSTIKRYSVTASGFHLIGKETERGWEQADDISTLLPSLLRYQNSGVVGEQLRQRLRQIPLALIERETGLSLHTILRFAPG